MPSLDSANAGAWTPRSAAARFETGAASHVGLVRKRNEDSYLAQPEIGVWAVADGMGGHEAGHFASNTVIHSLGSIGAAASAPDLLARFEDRVNRANSRLHALARERGGTIMGATVAALLAFDGYYACVWSGDARIYLVRGGAITQLSRDHTEAQELVDKGILSREEARNWPGNNVVTRAIGVRDDAELEIDHGMLETGDRFVVCSDGLTGHVEDREILETVQYLLPQDACDRLIALALERGGVDNVTVIVVRYLAGGTQLGNLRGNFGSGDGRR
jgi:protein phosphatase